MGTHCYIALEHNDGTITFIYCHFDGYFSGVGKLLYHYYTTSEVVEQLLEKGSITSLELPINDMKRYDPIEKWTAGDQFEFESEFYKHMDISYYYLFTKEKEWVGKAKDVIYLSELFTRG
jgi:hypothetical protein